MLSQRAPRALALAILLSCALLARAKDDATALVAATRASVALLVRDARLAPQSA